MNDDISAGVVDVGGGAGHQSSLLAEAGYGIAVLGLHGRADTVEDVSNLLRNGAVDPVR